MHYNWRQNRAAENTQQQGLSPLSLRLTHLHSAAPSPSTAMHYNNWRQNKAAENTQQQGLSSLSLRLTHLHRAAPSPSTAMYYNRTELQSTLNMQYSSLLYLSIHRCNGQCCADALQLRTPF
ncbi:UNVERIFIED_CONTAM: hypothetical protein FKN15_021660 [Acipenser sinensis]